MKLAVRTKALGRKSTLIVTAFVLAVSSLTAGVPSIVSQTVSAITPNCEIEFSADSQRCVDDVTELNAAIADTSVSHIILNDTIETSVPIVISRPLLLNGHDEKIKFTGDAAGWQGNFVVKVFNTAGVRINSLQVEGGDAGIQVNVSEVALSGNMRFINHEFGNIEMTKSSDASLTRAPKLAVASQATLDGDYNTTVNKPYVWVANNAVADAEVSPFLYRGLNRTTNAANFAQHWYFANPALTGVVATVVETGNVYGTPQEAVDAAVAGQTVLLNEDAQLSKALVLNKAITLNGNGKKLAATYSHTGVPADNGVYNTVVVVSANGVKVKNLTTTNTSTGQKPHGVVVDYKTGVEFTNVTLENGRAGMIVNGSGVTVTNLTTRNNSWYGVNVDKANAKLTVRGVSSHNEHTHLFTDSRADTSVQVVDPSRQYVRWWEGAGYRYVLDTSPPTVTAVADKPINPTSLNLTASDDQRLSRYDVEIYKNNNTELVKTWGDAVTEAALSRSFTSELAGLADGVYQLRATVSDLVGKSVNSVTREFTIDNTKPVISVSSSRGSTAAKVFQEVSFKLYDAGSKIDRAELNGEAFTSNNGSVWGDLDNVWANRGWSGAREGENTIVLYDKAGNSVSYDFVIDVKAPVVDITGVTDGETYTGPVSVLGTITDTNLKNYYLTVTKDGVNLPGTPKSGTTSTVSLNLTEDGEYMVMLEARDLAENKDGSATVAGVSVKTVRFTIDTTGPVVTLDDITAFTVGGQTFVSGVVAEPGVTEADVYVGGVRVDTTPVTDGLFNFSLSGLAEGTYNVVIVARDAFGNEGVSAIKTVTVNPAEVVAPIDPVVPVEPVGPSAPTVEPAAPESTMDNAPALTAPRTVAQAPALPFANGNNQGVLGQNDTPVQNTEDDQEVAGTSTEKTIAAAVSNTDGNALGFAWYWWLLAAAGGSVVLWWIIAALRRRSEEE